jgi:ArsR family transcriptional regulator
LADDAILELLASLRRMAETQSAGSNASYAATSTTVTGWKPFLVRSSWSGSRPELMERLKAGIVTVLDLRPEDEFALGHLATCPAPSTFH